MIRFVTIIGPSDGPVAPALIRSLRHHEAAFHLHLLAVDETAADNLAQVAPTQTTVLRLPRLLEEHPELRDAQTRLSEPGLVRHLRPWLLRYLLDYVPAGEFLTLLEPTVCFFRSPASLLQATGNASLILLRSAEPGPTDESTYERSWISLRHDAIGQACAQHWVERSLRENEAAWVARSAGPRLETSFPPTAPAHMLVRTGLSSPTANLLAQPMAAGPTLAGELLIAFNFYGLRRLIAGVYDPGPILRSAAPDSPFRQYIGQPYLHALEPAAPPAAAPDFVPLSDANDPRASLILAHVLKHAAEEHVASHKLRAALAETHATILRSERETRARTSESERYLQRLTLDRDKQRQSFFDTRQRLEEIHEDLLRNIAYLKKLEAESEAHKRAAQEREAYIANLKAQLSVQHHTGTAGTDLVQLHSLLHPLQLNIRRLLVARFNPALMPLLLSLASRHLTIEVLGSPENLQGVSHGGLHFLSGDLWNWLGGLSTHFDAAAYLTANPDVAAAIQAGTEQSAWEHCIRFGQFEGRSRGGDHRAGLADFDAIAFDSADAAEIVPGLIGRLQPHQQLFISSSFNPATVWLPADTPQTIVFGDLLYCARPSPAWLGPTIPAAVPVPHRRTASTPIPYPAAPTQPAAWPKISVLVTARAHTEDLVATFCSVFAQNYPMLECIAVGAETSPAISHALDAWSGQLSWKSTQSGLTPAQSVNLALSKSSGALVVWLQAGDRLAPGSLYTVAQQFLLHAPGLIGGRCLVASITGINAHRSVLSVGRLQPLPLAALTDVANFWQREAFFRSPALFYSREALAKIGGGWPDVPEPDFALALALAQAAEQVLPIPEILAEQSTANQPAHDPQILAHIVAMLNPLQR